MPRLNEKTGFFFFLWEKKIVNSIPGRNRGEILHGQMAEKGSSSNNNYDVFRLCAYSLLAPLGTELDPKIRPSRKPLYGWSKLSDTLDLIVHYYII